jgi:hypothetical protein
MSQQNNILENLLQGITSANAFQAAQYGLPGGQSFNYVPGAQQRPPKLIDQLLNIGQYAAPVLSAIGNSGEGRGWLGPALQGVGQVSAAKSYNQALQNAKLAEAQQAAANQASLLSNTQDLMKAYGLAPGVSITSPDVAQALIPQLAQVGRAQGEQGLSRGQARENLKGEALIRQYFGQQAPVPAAAPQGATPEPSIDDPMSLLDPTGTTQQPLAAGATKTALDPAFEELLNQLAVSEQGLQQIQTRQEGERDRAIDQGRLDLSRERFGFDQEKFGKDLAFRQDKLNREIDIKRKQLAKQTGRAQTKLEAAQKLLAEGKITEDEYKDYVTSSSGNVSDTLMMLQALREGRPGGATATPSQAGATGGRDAQLKKMMGL